MTRAALALALASAVVAVAGCGSATNHTSSSGITSKSSSAGGSTSASRGGAVTIDELIPLTGPSADVGPTDDLPGFRPAAAAINAAGGILGRPLKTVVTNLGGDPQDAVAFTRQMLATNPSLSGVVGLTSDTALVIGNLLNQAAMPTITLSGTDQLDHVQWKYVFRPFAADAAESIAMSAWALSHHWTRALLLFGANAGSQSVIPPLVASYKKHGGTVVGNDVLPLDKSSYQVELAQGLAQHPQVIFTETDPQTAATLFSELKTMNGLKIPVVATQIGAEGSYWKAVDPAVGGYATASKFLTTITTPAQYGGAGYADFLRYYNPLYSNTPANIYNAGNFESLTMMALAMDLAGSTNPKKYVSYIPEVVDNHSAPPVTSYAAGVAAIKAKKPFYFDGPLGPLAFNKYHSIGGAFVAQKLAPNGHSFETVGNIPDSEVRQYQY